MANKNVNNLFNAVTNVLSECICDENGNCICDENAMLISDIEVNVTLKNGKRFCIEANKQIQSDGCTIEHLHIQPLNI